MATTAMKLSKDTLANFSRLVAVVDEAQSAVEVSITDFNAAMDDQRDIVKEKVTAYNEAVGNLRSALEDARNEQQEAFDGKSERWQEGDRGQAAGEWITALESACDSLDPIAVDLPEDAVLPDFVDASAVESMPSEPEG